MKLVDITVNGLSAHELIRGIANNVFLNINIDPNLDFKIVNNFSNVKVKNIGIRPNECILEIKKVFNKLTSHNHNHC